MSKRSATEVVSEGQAFAKASSSGAKREPVSENLEFEDAWEDEIESDEEVVDAEAAEREDGT